MTPYASRRLRHSDSTSFAVTTTPASDLDTFLTESANTPFMDDMSRGDICAFTSGGMKELEQTDVTTQSILAFVPGVRVVIAAEAGSKPAYER